MNFKDSPKEAVFRAKVRSWLDANAPWHMLEEMSNATIVGTLTITSEDPVAASKAWQRKKADAGYAAPSWPKEFGGGGMTPMERVIWQQEEAAFKQLSVILSIGLGMCGPTLMEWGTAEQKSQLLPPMVRGDEVWCQMFSEPAAGSDLAGLRTRARRADDGSGDWIIDGQKIWTSYAHYSDWGLLLARTDPAVPKHKGLTMFHVAVNTPGLEVRPIRQINGRSTFNEVFFNSVRIPDTQRIGPVDEGWKVSLTTLMNERMTISSSSPIGFEEIMALARKVQTANGRAIDDPAVRSKLAHWATIASGLKYSDMRAISAISRGEMPGPENSIGKLVASDARVEISMFGVELQGQAGALMDPEAVGLSGWFQANLMRSPAMRIEGGSNEILRNIIGERVLGLPGEPRVDKGVPFHEIPAKGRG
jgi:alkylation response protein AidB-like acyl-CoA dehydrogenase